MFLSSLIFCAFVCFVCTEEKAPHIIFILADDMGWNDVSFHGSPQIPTPNIDALAASGLVLQNYYSAPQCTPSRASLMTGKYASRLGLQNFVINAGAPYGLPLSSKILPQYLKKLGYSTHGVGKWHLGYCKKEYTPTHRGFDSFFGYWNGVIDHYDFTNYEDHNTTEGIQVMWGVDLHNGTKAVTSIRGRYATDLFTDAAVDVIRRHDTNQPLFLYLSHLACHTGNKYLTMQAPPDYVKKFPYIADFKRRTYAGLVKKLDESVGKVVSALDSQDMLQNSIIVFCSDNGAEVEGVRGAHGSNWPLRSMKFHLWEGGVKVPALIWSPLLKLKSPRVVAQMMHISDWLPTLYSAAGGRESGLGKIDGMNMWTHLLQNKPLPRKETLLNINPVDGTAALVSNGFKLILGRFPDGNDFWYGPSGREEVKVQSMDEWVWKEQPVVKKIFEKNGMWLLTEPDSWRTELDVHCGECAFEEDRCALEKEACLYNIAEDPCEYKNVASVYPEVLETMMARLVEYNRTAVPPIQLPIDPRADPRCHEFSYVPWMDEEHSSECPDA